MKRNLLTIAAVLAVGLTACSTDADVASKNLSKAAEQFEIERRIVFFNGITDKYLLSVEGRCSIEAGNTGVADSLEVTCRVSEGNEPSAFKKHYLGLSDNVSYFVEQLDAAEVDEFHYRVIFRPEQIVPDVDLETSS